MTCAEQTHYFGLIMSGIDPSVQAPTELRLVETAHLLSWLLQVVTLTQMKKSNKRYSISI